MATWTRTDSPWLDLYAENARPASGADLSCRCPVCRRIITAGERVADLTGERGVIHCACIAVQADRIGASR